MATYTGERIKDLDIGTPLEGAWKIREVNDAIQEIKRCVKNTIEVGHDLSTGKHLEYFFMKTGTLASATGNTTPLVLITDAEVPAGKAVYVAGYIAHVNGATDWTDNIFIECIGGSSFVKFSSSSLNGNKVLTNGRPDSDIDESHLGSPYLYADGLGGTAAKGLQVRANTDCNGSDLIITVYGMIK